MAPIDLSNIEAIFLDDGGVMNDNERRGRQWRRHLAEYLVPRFSESHAAWEEANTAVITRQMKLFIDGVGFPLQGGYRAARRKMSIEWVRDMFQIVGVAAPADDEECLKIFSAATDYVIQRLRTDFPGAVEAIRSLHDTGFKLYPASGTDSFDLEVYLENMGVRDLFTHVGGPDLIDTHKGSHHFYEGSMADANVSPENTLFVDDSSKSVGWATEAGARAVLISQTEIEPGDAVAVLNSLAQLPAILATADR
jgi:phosphoglycolate phosphatase-like HAD superfamily hydrolase